MSDDMKTSGHGMWEDFKNQYGVIKARIMCLRYMEMHENRASPVDQEFFRELREAMATEKNLKGIALYRNSYDYAQEKGEEMQFDISDYHNVWCAGEIDEAIEACRYKGGGIEPKPGVQALIEHFGSERLSYVLAIEVLRNTKAFSDENRAWAQGFGIQNSFAKSGIETHPYDIDKFITCFRETIDKALGAELPDEPVNIIRFIKSDYKELFCIPDGGEIKITYPPDDGREAVTRSCKFLGEMHVRVGNSDYHICEFAERMEQIGATYEPVVQLENAKPVPFTAGEEKFLTYNREESNTCIGHIGGDFGNNGDRISYSFSDRKSGRNTPEFQTELHSAVYALRHSVLKDHQAMREFCQANPDAKLPDRGDLEHYGFKLATESRQYFILCAAEAAPRESHFKIYAYDSTAPELKLTPVTVDERKMFFLNKEDGCVGYLRGDFGKSGDEFWHSWFDGNNSRNTPEFKSEFQEVMETLRQGVLKDFKSAVDYCRNHPEARIPGEPEHRFGFKMETDDRQYFIRCTMLRDDNFYIFAYDKNAPVLENATIIEPQAYAERLLIGLCVDGLGQYAAQQAQIRSDSPVIKDTKELVERLVSYFALNEGEDARLLNRFLWDFDEQVSSAKASNESIFADTDTARNVIYGLYLYGNDMVTSQGEIAMSEILEISGWMKEIAKAWDFEPDVLDKLTANLESKVLNMLHNYPTPGQPVTGLVNTGYEFLQAVMYDNDEGFVLACNPKAVQPFVTWEFKVDNGSVDCFWGNYFSKEQDAYINYIERTIRHKNLNSRLQEKPLPETISGMEQKEKPSVIEKIKASQKAPKQAKKPKPEQAKKKNEPEL